MASAMSLPRPRLPPVTIAILLMLKSGVVFEMNNGAKLAAAGKMKFREKLKVVFFGQNSFWPKFRLPHCVFQSGIVWV
jgi:hypothetical protein